MTDANLSEKAAAAVDTAADTVKDAASTATASVQKAAETTAADVTKAAESAKAATAKAAGEVKAEASKAAGTTKAAATKAADSAKATATEAKATVDKAVAGTSGPAKDAKPPRSAAQIEADLDVVRARLAGRIDDLEDYVAPKNVAKRGVDSVKSVFVDEYGGVKPDRVLMAVGAVVLLVGLRAVGRRRRHR